MQTQRNSTSSLRGSRCGTHYPRGLKEASRRFAYHPLLHCRKRFAAAAAAAAAVVAAAAAAAAAAVVVAAAAAAAAAAADVCVWSLRNYM
jgi:hypothetical protein